MVPTVRQNRLKFSRIIPASIRLICWRVILFARTRLEFLRPTRSIRTADATYCPLSPSKQTAIDIFKGVWTTAFPQEFEIVAGAIRHFEHDVRVPWVHEKIAGGLANKTVLELGPYEAYSTWQLERSGARGIVAIESNDVNFLKCLIVKELTGMQADFLYGDFVPFLERSRERFDLIWASGVLYHSIEPLRLLRGISQATDMVFLHTHYYIDEVIKKSAHACSFFCPKRNRIEQDGEFSARLHYRRYGQRKSGNFSGGAHDYAYWMEREDIFAFLRHCGFDQIIMGVDHPNNPNGPALFCLARRTTAANG